MNNFQVDLTPSKEDLYEIRTWANHLSANWSTIMDSFYKGALAVAKFENKVVGYFACRRLDITVLISLAETKTEYQNQGIASLLLDELTNFYINTKFKAFSLYCSPEESQYFWSKKGFSYYPKNRDEEKIYMYKLIGKVELPHEKNSDSRYQNYIEIWDKELPKENEQPKWICELKFKKDSHTLENPIIFFGDDRWRIRLMINNKLNEFRYKDLDRNNDIGDCFYIVEIKKHFC